MPMSGKINNDQEILRLRKDLERILRTDSGRRVLWRILGVCEFGMQPYRDSPMDTAFYCGKLEVGRWLAEAMEDARKGSMASLMLEMLEYGENSDDHGTRNAPGGDNSED